MQFKNMIFILQ